MPIDRRQARILAMQVLCQWDVQGDESPEALEDFFQTREAAVAVAGYAAKLVQAFWHDRKAADDRMAQACLRWDLARISPVERNIMRVALMEVFSGNVPVKVALNEAIEIAREFGGQESPRFVNGVLDEVIKTWQASKKDDG